ncbi:hypothetical protein HBB16_20300 [Pseudonocardia sp. MCCB 268]|nr:hypothetical protein [Pseudonocardia cytotoxica]
MNPINNGLAHLNYIVDGYAIHATRRSAGDRRNHRRRQRGRWPTTKLTLITGAASGIGAASAGAGRRGATRWPCSTTYTTLLEQRAEAAGRGHRRADAPG